MRTLAERLNSRLEKADLLDDTVDEFLRHWPYQLVPVPYKARAPRDMRFKLYQTAHGQANTVAGFLKTRGFKVSKNLSTLGVVVGDKEFQGSRRRAVVTYLDFYGLVLLELTK